MTAYLGEPNQQIKLFILERYSAVSQLKTYVRYVDGSGYIPTELSVSGELYSTSIPHIESAKEIYIGDMITSVSQLTGCPSLTAIAIPGSVQSVAANAFSECAGLSADNSIVFVEKSAEALSTMNNYPFGKSGHTNVFATWNVATKEWTLEKLEEYSQHSVIPEGVSTYIQVKTQLSNDGYALLSNIPTYSQISSNIHLSEYALANQISTAAQISAAIHLSDYVLKSEGPSYIVVADQSVTEEKIVGELPTEKLQNSSISPNKLADGSVTGEKLSSNQQITAQKIASNSIQTSKIADDALSGSHFTGSIASSKIADGSIAYNKLADNSVTASKLSSSGSIASSQLQDGSIQYSKIADGAVIASKLSAEGSITNQQLADGSIAVSRIADNAVTNSKLSQNGSIDDSQLAASSIQTSRIANNAISSAHLAGTISGLQIAEGQITTDKIAAATISAGNIADSAVVGLKIASNTISVENLAESTIEALSTSLNEFKLNSQFVANIRAEDSINIDVIPTIVGDGTHISVFQVDDCIVVSALQSDNQQQQEDDSCFTSNNDITTIANMCLSSTGIVVKYCHTTYVDGKVTALSIDDDWTLVIPTTEESYCQCDTITNTPMLAPASTFKSRELCTSSSDSAKLTTTSDGQSLTYSKHISQPMTVSFSLYPLSSDCATCGQQHETAIDIKTLWNNKTYDTQIGDFTLNIIDEETINNQMHIGIAARDVCPQSTKQNIKVLASVSYNGNSITVGPFDCGFDSQTDYPYVLTIDVVDNMLTDASISQNN